MIQAATVFSCNHNPLLVRGVAVTKARKRIAKCSAAKGELSGVIFYHFFAV
jgi:hypothetical protein